TPAPDFHGTVTFTYRADDGTDTSELATVTITITPVNDPPVIEAEDLVLSAESIAEGGAVNLSGTFIDPDEGQEHTILIDWGDGSPVQTLTLPVGSRSFGPVAHTYRDDDPTGTPSDLKTITVTVRDEADASSSASRTVTVSNVAPVV